MFTADERKETLKKLVAKYQIGDALSDQELADLLGYFGDLYKKTRYLPDEFALFNREIQRIYFRLEDYDTARKSK